MKALSTLKDSYIYIKYMVMYTHNNMHGYNNAEAGLGGMMFST